MGVEDHRPGLEDDTMTVAQCLVERVGVATGLSRLPGVERLREAADPGEEAATERHRRAGAGAAGRGRRSECAIENESVERADEARHLLELDLAGGRQLPRQYEPGHGDHLAVVEARNEAPSPVRVDPDVVIGKDDDVGARLDHTPVAGPIETEVRLADVAGAEGRRGLLGPVVLGRIVDHDDVVEIGPLRLERGQALPEPRRPVAGADHDRR